MKKIMTIIITSSLTLLVLLGTNIGGISSNDKAYALTKNDTLKPLVNQTDPSELSQIAANKAKQEEIDRIAAKKSDSSKEMGEKKSSKIASTAKIALYSLTTEDTAKLSALGLKQTAIGAKLSTYLSSSANIVNVLNKAIELHSGDSSNNCVYFSSEAMRRIGRGVPMSMCNTLDYIHYLRSNAWVSSSNIKELTPGSICFTVSNGQGYPTHTFVFMGWVTDRDYTSAYVADNQGTSVHIRNMGSTYATDAFASFMHTPTPPTKVTVSSSGYSSIKLNWSAVAGETGYEIYRATSSTGSYSLLSRTTALSYNNTGLITNKTYYYKIRTYKVVGSVNLHSSFSDVDISKPIPSLPTSFKATSSSYTSINTNWSTVAGANGYEVYGATSSDGLYTLLSSTTGNNYNHIGLITSSTYYYKIRAFRMVGTVKMCSIFSDPISAMAIPSSPILKTTSSSISSINTTWSAVPLATGYEVYKSPSSNSPYTLLLDTTGISFEDTGLTINTNYYYKVRAYMVIDNLKVYGNCSSVISSKPVPAAPTNVKAAKTSSISIRLSWNKASGANAYELFRATSSGGTYTFVSSMSSTYYTNSRLAKGKTYYYKIRPYFTVGKTKVYGNWSVVVPAKL
ncbi:hypothetical protein KPL37_15650 [Clostridium frigoris]|uniref:Fibronectin type-III domain-containing protein n=1 Tax=Clostridium frigoris TaxID=205327 RepID=A0ABS6BX30_9CLOT|nr:hypothetical protein [Clostridium frigoris]MBU3161155.1 hypothetical protein [Clostridium frigoris]